MTFTRSFRSRAALLRRAFWPVLVVVAGAVTCDSPTTAKGRMSLALAPRFGNLSMSGFTGLVVDSVRITVTEPPSRVLGSQTFGFSADSASIDAQISIPLSSARENVIVLLEFLSNSQVLFTGSDTVTVTAGVTNAPAAPVVSYVGPGSGVAALHITPRDSGATFGAAVPFTVTATDSQNNSVAQFYVKWSTSRAGDTINAAGQFRAGTIRGLAWVRARTPSGIWDSARIAVVPVPTAIAVTAGDHLSGPVSTALAQQLVVRVKAADSLPVVGARVVFAAVSGGGSVNPALAATDTAGYAKTTVTLGATLGPQTFSATIQGTSTAAFAIDTALNAHGVAVAMAKVAGDSQVTTPGAIVAIAPKVKVTDAFGAAVAGVTVTFSVTTGGGSVTGGSVVTDANGLAQVGSWTMGPSPSTFINNTLTASASGTNSVTFGALAHAFANVSVAASNVAGVARAGALVVKLSQPDPVRGDTIFVVSDSAAYLRIATPGLVIFAPGDTVKTILDTGIAAGTAVVRVFGGPNSYSGSTLNVPVTTNLVILPPLLAVNQGFIDTVTVQLSSAAPGGGVPVGLFSSDTTKAKWSTPTVAVPAGQTTAPAYLLGVGAGAATVIAGAPSYAPAQSVVTVVGSAVASTTVSPHFDTLTSLTDTFRLTAQAKNAAGGNTSGTFTWVSRDTTKVLVNAIGSVFAVANGSTYVVATEAGGTKDSSLVTVQQRVATINVTPGTRNIYLGGHFTFTAAAVDGRGHPIASVTAFTWTTTAPAVAQVDTSHVATNQVQALGIGSAQIKAQSGAIIGVANVSVLTAITRIAVVVDTAFANKTDTFSLNSLGLTRRYHAVAFDTLNAVMPSVTAFSWVSTNGAVATLDSTGLPAVHPTATAQANGVTTINATAQGFTSNPGALLTVSQVLASIELKPDTNNPTATIGVGGTMHVSARGKDANSRYLAGGTFIYHRSALGNVSVDSVTGLVTGQVQGTDTITATSGAITSNKVVVTVSNGGPAIISFGRDTLSVGRGNQQAFPILLSRPDTAAMIVKLTAPAFAHWQTPTVAIPQGQTSVNAMLIGDSAGTVTVTAVDSSRHIFASASAVAKVTANLRLTSTSYYINATDIATTQVLLSDPSPAGGTYVTFSYTKSGVASISPDPAFIPQGQLAADIQIRGLTGDTTHITPNALGVNGAPSYFQAYAPVITAPTLVRLGAGQYEPSYGYVQVPTYTNVAVPVTLTVSDTNIVTAPALVTINGGQYYNYFQINAKAVGSATITPSATGWTAGNSITVVSTTPHVGMCCGGTINTTSPTQTVTIYAEDSLGSAHYRTNSLLVHLRSSDTLRIKLIDTVVTIAAGQYYVSGARLVPAGLGGSAYVIATAGGHTPDSTLWTVVPPALAFSWYSNTLGTGQYDANEYVSRPNTSPSPLIVAISNSNPTAVSLPAVDTILSNQYYGYFSVLGNAPGSATMVASVAGYQPDTAYYQVSSPRLVAACCSGQIYNFSPGTSAYAFVADSIGYGHYRSAPLTVSVHSTNTAKVLVDSTSLTITAGQFYTTSAHVTPVDTGSAYIVFTAGGHKSDSLLVTVIVPKVNLSLSHYNFSPSSLGRRQHFDPTFQGFYVSVPNNRTSPLATTITQKHPSVDSLTTTNVTIPAGTSYTYLDAFGLANGLDTLIVSAPGYYSDTVYISVNTPRLYTCCMPGTATTTNPPFGLTVYAQDSTGQYRYPMDTVTVRAASSDTTVLRPAQAYFKIPKNSYYASTTVNVVGPGTGHMSYADSNTTSPNRYDSTVTSNVTVTGPSFGISNGTPVLGMRQTGGLYSANVYTQNAVVSPLLVHLVSTDTHVVTVPDTVTIQAGSNYAYFPITAMSTTGTIQIQATATGYTQASSNVQVTQPKFIMYTTTQLNTTSPRYSLYVYAADANGSSHYTTDTVVVSLSSSAPSVANIDSSTITILKGNYVSSVATWGPGVIGTAQLTAADNRAVSYKYNSASVNVAVVQPSVSLSWSTRYLGIGQYDDYAYASTPDYQRAAASVGLTHVGPARIGTYANQSVTPISGLTIDSGTSYKYFRVAGATPGTDTLIASISSPAHRPDTAFTVVDSGRVDPISNWPSSLTLSGADSALVTMYALDQNQSSHNVLSTSTFTLTPGSHIEFHDYTSHAVITSVQIPADAYYVQFWVKGVSAGASNAQITAPNYHTYVTPTITVSP